MAIIDLMKESQKIKKEVVSGNKELLEAINEHINHRGLDHIKRVYPEPSVTEKKGWALFKLGHYSKKEPDPDMPDVLPESALYKGFDFEHAGNLYEVFALHPYEVFRHDIVSGSSSDLDYLNIIYMLEKKAQFFEDMSFSGKPITEFCIGLVAGRFAALLLGGKSPAQYNLTKNMEYLNIAPSVSTHKPQLRYMALENLLSAKIPKDIENKLRTK